MDLDYKNKYLKYKMKYLILQQQVGSSQTFTSIIVTHNGRMRCLLDTLGLSDENINPDKKRFMNCAVLELIISPTDISANLRIPGDLAGEGKIDKYFTSFNKTIVNNSIINTNGNTFIFYIIRHGHGKHNLAKELGTSYKLYKMMKGVLYDPDLTDAQDQAANKKMTSNGQQQAINSGKELITQIPDLKIDFLFASDLKRTRQTLYKILEGTGIQILKENVSTVTILPCSHELDYKENGCDGHQITNAQENTMNCTVQNTCNTNPNSSQNDYCSSIPAISTDPNPHNLCLNWIFYQAFYGGTRKEKESSYQCRHTNMFQQAIFIIESNEDINKYRNNLKQIIK
jgi:broad specificity phosphatase PhoE